MTSIVLLTGSEHFKPVYELGDGHAAERFVRMLEGMT